MKKKIIISYARVSTKEQLKGHSIEAQTEMLNNHIRYYYSEYEVERYSDKGKNCYQYEKKWIKTST